MIPSLTVLGYRAGRPDRTSACSGYLVRHQDTKLLVDCGPGITHELLSRELEHDLDGIVLTHLHQDHMFDLVPLAFTRLLTDRQPPRIPLWVPEASLEALHELDRWIEVPTDPLVGLPLATAFDIQPMVRDGKTAVEAAPGIGLTAFTAKHVVPSASLRLDLGGATLAFSSDTGWCDGVLAAARGADVFVCETTYLDADPKMLEEHGHLTAELTGRLAREAGVGHLIASHLIGTDDQEALRLATAVAGDVPVTLAAVGLEIAVQTMTGTGA